MPRRSTVSPTLVCWSKRRTPPSGSVYVLIIYGNLIISFYYVSRQIQKASLNCESELLMLVCFRRSAHECHRWLRHMAVKLGGSWQCLLLTVKTSPWICWVARELVCIALRRDERVDPQLRTRMDASRFAIKPTSPAVSIVCYFSIQTVSQRQHHTLALCLCLCCLFTKDKKGIAVRAVRIFYL